ncbi:bifunctional folylpolyglutamate synthase/dihydrofolate synthase [Deinococcus sp. SDU3-2]|uniref:tetrahydrofolate synthase n=1 Tax=Deinococcus terrestris TaxID=2651870 RepID=A0A7X1NXW6_9DEIO|nr:folylpolyglutamate synthase/dihydrofolate synthase family protein [Deinococcus terrestris]MPY67830.1 bifunctional folylpolyglutamate synthase/dihydrofolate synthase [Deinococcus terrestris]
MTDLDWLFARQRFGVHPGLGRVQALLTRLGEPQRNFRSVLVGGTNGKGSTAASLAAMLTASGTRTALFTSPHLTRFAERFLVDGRECPAERVGDALRRVRPHAEAAEASFFEIVTALGCLLFAEAGVEVAVMEVGLGGRLDATNILDPDLSVITTVALDHTEILGETVEAIAEEKAGILRPGRPAVTGVDPALWPRLEAQSANLWALGREVQVEAQSRGWDGWNLRIRLPDVPLDLRTPLLGEHGARNAALAAAAAWRLGVGEPAIRVGAAGVVWPGRMEVLPWRGGRVLLDGAHNPAGAHALASALRDLGTGPLPLIFGAASGKDVAGVASALREAASEVILTRAHLSPRVLPPEELAPHFAGTPVRLADSPQDALALLPEGGTAVVCGSLYLIGEVRPLLLGEVPETRERWQ